jgi:hypothetical protein
MFTLFGSREKFVLTTSRRGMTKLVLNPPKGDRKRGVYYPYLTLINRRNKLGIWEEGLMLQVSLPKLMFGNNFDELSERNFPEVVAKLKRCLQMMDVRVFETLLENAEVVAIHFGKNIILQDGTTAKMLIDKIAQGEYSVRLDTELTKYRNNGLGWKLHTNHHEVAFYDKKADLAQAKISERRSEETDNYPQLNLFDKPKEYRPLEVLRMEVRLNSSRMIKQVFEKASITTPKTFKSMFSEATATKVLLHYVSISEEARPEYFDYLSRGPSDLLAEVKIRHPKLSLAKLLALSYLKQATDQGDTLGSIREVVTHESSVEWNRLMKIAREIKVPCRDYPFAPIRDQITNYKPVSLLEYRERMLSNDKRSTL